MTCNRLISHAVVAVLSLPVVPMQAAAQTDPAAQSRGNAAPTIRQADQDRLNDLDAATGVALRQVLTMGDPTQLGQAKAALTGEAVAADQVTPQGVAGDWSCSMTKIGGNLPAVTYPPFRCRIEAKGDGFSFEKLTGSQRTTGTVNLRDGRWIYLGTNFVEGDKPRPYADFAEDHDVSTGDTPDVGVFEATGADSGRILLPRPYHESILNVLTLTR